MPKKYRLVTRSDFDGLVCAVLFKELDLIEDILLVHPKDMADGKIAITDSDITTNLPYNEKCYMAFDHHASEAIRLGFKTPDNLILEQQAYSAARVVYQYYGGREKFPNVRPDLMTAVDKADAARFTEDEILDPSGWAMLNFIMDPRTGLGRFKNFSISNRELMLRLVDYCRENSVEEILDLPDVRERAELYFEHADKAKMQIRRCSSVHGKMIVLDLRKEETIYCTNRFMVYALCPKSNISIHVVWGHERKKVCFAMGHSILSRTSPVNVGELMLKYGGGGHVAAGTCQIEVHDAECVLDELIEHVKEAEYGPMIETSAVIEIDTPSKQVKAPTARAEAKPIADRSRRAPTKKDIAEIHRRLDQLEKQIAELTSQPVGR